RQKRPKIPEHRSTERNPKDQAPTNPYIVAFFSYSDRSTGYTSWRLFGTPMCHGFGESGKAAEHSRTPGRFARLNATRCLRRGRGNVVVNATRECPLLTSGVTNTN